MRCKTEIKKKTHCNFSYHFALWLIPVCLANLLMAIHTLPGVLVTPKLSMKAHVHLFLFILNYFLSYWSGLAGQKTRDACCCLRLCPVTNGNQVIRNLYMQQPLVSPSFRWETQLRRWHVLLGMIFFLLCPNMRTNPSLPLRLLKFDSWEKLPKSRKNIQSAATRHPWLQ